MNMFEDIKKDNNCNCNCNCDNNNDDNKTKNNKSIKNEKVKMKLDHPVRVYFNSDDYKVLSQIANKQGLELSQFIRNKMKYILEVEENKKINKINDNEYDNNNDNNNNNNNNNNDNDKYIKKEGRNNKTILTSISRDNKSNEDKFNTLILKLSFCEVQYNNTSGDNKLLILTNMEKIADQIVDLIVDDKKEECRYKIYNVIQTDRDVEKIIKLKLERYLKNNNI